MDYEYHIQGRANINGDASASINHMIDKTDIFLHPHKCSNCKKYFPDMEDQMISSINHEVQESLVCNILRKEKGYYKNEWFDNTSRKQSNDEYSHICKKWWQIDMKISTLFTSGYFR